MDIKNGDNWIEMQQLVTNMTKWTKKCWMKKYDCYMNRNLLYELLESLFCSQEISKRKLKLFLCSTSAESLSWSIRTAGGWRLQGASGSRSVTVTWPLTWDQTLTTTSGSERIAARSAPPGPNSDLPSIGDKVRQELTASSVLRLMFGVFMDVCLQLRRIVRQEEKSQALKERKRPWF